ncbi:hypothetical protein RYX27_17845 [Providencia hangzhouensis]
MNYIRKAFPSLLPSANILAGYFYDAYKFIRFNTNNAYRLNQDKHDAIIRRKYHGIEKAFSLPEVRKGFGKSSCLQLIDELGVYYVNYGYTPLIQASLDILNHYIEFHKGYIDNDISLISEKLNVLSNKVNEYKKEELMPLGGLTTIHKKDIEAINKEFGFYKFCQSRYTTRDFSNEVPEKSKIERAIINSIKTPSVCNRQAWKVHFIQGDKLNSVLDCQNGNRGFRNSINTILLVTGTLSSFSNSERNQVYVDGGLFSMSLIYSLHSENLGVCALNTAYKVKDEIKLRKSINLPNNEVPIMMLAVGNLKESFEVANSMRKDLSEIIHYN